MTKKIIVVDIDGVLADFNTGYARVLMGIAPYTKVDHLASDFPPVWDWPEHFGYTKNEIEAARIEMSNSGLFWRSLFPYASAWNDLDYLNSLRGQHDIYFVTARFGKTPKEETEHWLEGHGFKCPTVVICKKKGEFCEAVAADIMIDDKPGNLITSWHPLTTILIKRPYNANWWEYFNRTADTIREGLDGLV